MLDLLVITYQNWQNYIFGNFTITFIAFAVVLLGYMFIHGFSIETTLVIFTLGLIVTAVWLVPTWTITIMLIILGLLLTWGLSKLFGGGN